MVMMAVKLLVKITVMMMAPGGTLVPPEAREREPPPSSCLTFHLDGRRVSPLVHGIHGGGGAGAPPRLDLSLSFCFCAPRFCPFTVS